MTAKSPVLKTAIGTYGHTRSIKDISLGSDRFSLEQVEISPLPRAFRMMVNDLTFDVSEMALTTHALARSYDRPVVGLPIVLQRNFHHGALWINNRSGIAAPADLAGRRIGVRAYSQTTGVWLRGILQEEYGLDPFSVTWVTFESAHVRQYQDPPNVLRAPEGKALKGMLLSGEIDGAIIGNEQIDHPDVRPLFADPEAAAAAWYQKQGVYPVNHILVLREDLAAAEPWLPGELFSLFKNARDGYLARLQNDGPADAEDQTRLDQARIVGGNPLPYGLAPNLAAVEACVRYAHQQRLLPRQFAAEELFHASVLDCI